MTHFIKKFDKFNIKLFGICKIIIVCIMIIMVTSCHKLDRENYCKFLISKAGEEKVQNYIDSWVKENFIESNWAKEKISRVSPYLPDYVSYNAKLDWEILGMSERAAVLLIGSHPTTDPEEFLFDHVESIYFTESSRVGIVYDVGEIGVFGFRDRDKYINRITENIGVMCMIPK